MTEQHAIEIFQKFGAVRTNVHVRLVSGDHAGVYLNKDMIFPHTKVTDKLCEGIADEFRGVSIQAVIAPAIGGVVLSQSVARSLALTVSGGGEILALYAERRTNGAFMLRPHYGDLVRGQRVLVVEDIVTRGDSVRSVIDLTRGFGGEVVGVGALWNRGDVTAEFLDVPRFSALVNQRIESWPSVNCPLCIAGMPIDTGLGHGQKK